MVNEGGVGVICVDCKVLGRLGYIIVVVFEVVGYVVMCDVDGYVV